MIDGVKYNDIVKINWGYNYKVRGKYKYVYVLFFVRFRVCKDVYDDLDVM